MSQATSADWYGNPSEVQQGSIGLSFPMILPPSGQQTKAKRRILNAIVLTQSCDIPKSAQESLLVAEVHDYLTMYEAGAAHLKDKDYRRSLARGASIADFLLPPDERKLLNWSVVNFRSLYVVDRQTFIDHYESTETKLSLVSPYIEHLSQAFARFMMRVGLPSGLQSFEKLDWASWA